MQLFGVEYNVIAGPGSAGPNIIAEEDGSMRFGSHWMVADCLLLSIELDVGNFRTERYSVSVVLPVEAGKIRSGSEVLDVAGISQEGEAFHR